MINDGSLRFEVTFIKGLLLLLLLLPGTMIPQIKYYTLIIRNEL